MVYIPFCLMGVCVRFDFFDREKRVGVEENDGERMGCDGEQSTIH